MHRRDRDDEYPSPDDIHASLMEYRVKQLERGHEQIIWAAMGGLASALLAIVLFALDLLKGHTP